MQTLAFKILLAISVFSSLSDAAPFGDSTGEIEKTSPISALGANYKCKGIKFPTFDIGKLMESISGAFGFCETTVSNKNLKCANGLLSKYKNTANLAPSIPLSGKLATEACGSSKRNTPSMASVAAFGQNMFSYQSNVYRNCLQNGTGNCVVNSLKLPTAQEDAEKVVVDTALLASAGRNIGATGSLGAEHGAKKETKILCDNPMADAACAANFAGAAIKTKTEEMSGAAAISGAVEAGLLKDATTPHNYFFETSSELMNNLPISKRANYASGSKRAMAAESFFAKQSHEISKIEKELLEAQKNKLSTGSMPILQSSIRQYVSAISGALDGLPTP